MADVMKLVDGSSNEVEFSPRPDYKAPQALRMLKKVAIDGTVHLIQPQQKKKWTIPLNAVNATDYAQFLSWWQDMEALTFYPDLTNTPTTTYAVKITNNRNPFRLMANPSYYEGTLILREV